VINIDLIKDHFTVRTEGRGEISSKGATLKVLECDIKSLLIFPPSNMALIFHERRKSSLSRVQSGRWFIRQASENPVKRVTLAHANRIEYLRTILQG
jgi:hypothetical protein